MMVFDGAIGGFCDLDDSVNFSLLLLVEDDDILKVHVWCVEVLNIDFTVEWISERQRVDETSSTSNSARDN